MARKMFKGAAPQLGLVGNINAAATTFIAQTGAGSAAGYPDGSTGNFVVEFGYNTATVEKVLCSARSGTTFTVAGSGRGYDDTTASSWNTGATVDHVLDAVSVQAFDDHINDVTHTHAWRDTTNTFALAQTFTAGATFNSTVSVAGATTLSGTAAITGAATFASTATVTGAATFNGRATFNGIVDVGVSLRPVGAGTLLVQDTGGASLAELFARTDVAVSSTALKLFWRDDGGTFRYDAVTAGAAGTGGAGKRLLVVPN